MLKGLGEVLPLRTSRGRISRKGSTAPPRGQTEPQSSILGRRRDKTGSSIEWTSWITAPANVLTE